MVNDDLIKKILSNPDNDNFDGYNEQVILDCKAWLIDEGYAKGPRPIINSETEVRFVQAVLIRDITDKGRQYLLSNGQMNAKTEITHNNYNMNIHENNGVASVGNNNIINSKFEEKFTQLVQSIEQTNIEDKSEIILKLNELKEDKAGLQKYLGMLLSRGTEAVTLGTAIVELLSSIGG